MNRNLTRWTIVACLCCAPAPAWADSASCLVRVTFNPRILPLSHEIVEALAETAGVLGVATQEYQTEIQAFREEYGYSMEDTVSVSFVRVEQGAAGKKPVRDVVLGRLQVNVIEDLPNATPIAARVLAVVTERLKLALAEAGQRDHERFVQEVALAREEVARATQRLAEGQQARQVVCQQAGRYDLDRDEIIAELKNLQREQASTELRLIVRQAQQDAISEQIAQIGKNVAAQASADPVLPELEKILALREQALEYAQARLEDGRISAQETIAAQEAVARARMELADRRRMAGEIVGGDLLRELNHKLLNLSIDTPELRVQLAFIQNRLADAEDRNLLQLADRFAGELEVQLLVAQEAAHDTAAHLRDLERDLRGFQPPSIMILGGASAE